MIEKNTEFVRYQKYLVAKRSDVIKHLTPTEANQLTGLLEKVDVGRLREGKDFICCVVVEDDWPEYETVWNMIEDRVKND